MPGRLLPAYLAALSALAVYSLLRGPIIAFDTDLWYHLSHGRFLFEHGHIPDTSYFSYLTPERQWVDYYWLFQALVYGIYSLTGYWGLLVLRATLYAALLALVAALLRQRPRVPGGAAWAALVFVLFLVQSLARYTLVRPHTVSFVALALFLYLLEARPAKAYLLPLVAVLWVNFHGVTYPVLILVCLAYAAELFLRRRGSGFDRGELRLLLALCASMAAVFATPHGTALLRVPFTSTELASHYVRELARPELAQFFSYSLSTRSLPVATAFNLLGLIAVLCAVGSLARRSARASHLAMLAGGLALLARADRFHLDLALLALPLVAAYGPLLTVRIDQRAVKAVAAGLLLLAPWPALREHFPHHAEAYPLSPRNLPHGIAAFLRHAATGGAVMCPADQGGYLAWELYPRYRISMDMEIPFLFGDEDIYRLAAAYNEPEALRKTLAGDAPGFIVAPLDRPDFRDLIAAHPRYVPVFLDDVATLYADAGRHPRLAARYRLDAVDPFALGDRRFSTLDGEHLDALLGELERIAGIAPGIVSVSQAAAIIHNLRGRPEQALAYAEAVIAADPRVARGYAIKADALRGLGRGEQAVGFYRRALEVPAEEDDRRSIWWSLASCYLELGRDDAAYRALVEASGIFNPLASYADLYNLGVLAARRGDASEARRWLDLAAFKVPPDEVEWKRRIEENLAALAAGGRDQP